MAATDDDDYITTNRKNFGDKTDSFYAGCI